MLTWRYRNKSYDFNLMITSSFFLSHDERWNSKFCKTSHIILSFQFLLKFWFNSSVWNSVKILMNLLTFQEMGSDSHSSLSKQSCDYTEFSIYLSYIKGFDIRYSISFELSFTQSVHIVQRHGYWTSIEALSKLTFSTSAYIRWWFQLLKH